MAQQKAAMSAHAASGMQSHAMALLSSLSLHKHREGKRDWDGRGRERKSGIRQEESDENGHKVWVDAEGWEQPCCS